MGITATLYVPDRVIEGYGLNTQALEELSMNHELIICVDCGTSSHGPIKNLNGKADLVILDHHIGSEELPDALAIINPNRQDELTDFRYLCTESAISRIFSKSIWRGTAEPPAIISFGFLSTASLLTSS